MANPKHVEVVRQGKEAIAKWRQIRPEERLDLSGAYLRKANIRDANLSEADLIDANLRGANLCDAVLHGANLSGADLFGAAVCRADVSDANLRRANLDRTNLLNSDVSLTDLREANLAPGRIPVNTTHFGMRKTDASSYNRAFHRDPRCGAANRALAGVLV